MSSIVYEMKKNVNMYIVYIVLDFFNYVKLINRIKRRRESYIVD